MKVIDVLESKYNFGYTFSMKTAISIPDKVFRSADALAKRLGVSRSQFYTTAVNELLLKHQGRQVTERLNSIYADEDSSLPSDLISLQTRSVAREEW